ncbi:exodeoxyribonuclease I subunit D [Hydrogenoanaerobacterium saccharovorans]|uniref:Nuclease SbcCD subunit D n=1 Tax=Hydrogenoanaerobacterium saccharovorans TaxID=474960 RepID=A0A1H7ZC40_9FIRM|nr:exonuclease SbcCD subunit D [Hydrogenoanaerobacterium saccharovorans]RPF48738.1 exodeoxyribonuclease I subunit D [Hydrogenoanaerobacterium saccharovorans]SEM55128.1 Exodeoxyribonuclease I subunit D [Hydrogenoanaerobacterium saccharovorans]
MRIVHTSDWHLGKIVNEFSMLDDQRFILKQMIDFLVQQKAELLVIAGDLYDRSIPPADAVSLLDEVFYRITVEAGIPIIAVSGNHDSPQRLNFASRIYERSGLYVEGIYNKTIRKITLQDEFGNIHFYCLPYIEPAIVRADFPDEKIHSYDDAFRTLIHHNLTEIDLTERNVLVTHGFFSYLKNPDAVERSDSEISIGGSDLIDASYVDMFDYVALGHLHRQQKAGRDNIRYSGSPLKYSIQESTSQKSITTIEMREKGELSIKKYGLTPRRDMRVLLGSFEQLSNAANVQGNREDYVYAQLTDDSLIPCAMDKLRTVYPNIMGMELIGRKHEFDASVSAAAAVKNKTPQELFEEFYSAVKGEEITDSRRTMASKLFSKLQGGYDDETN